MLPVRRNKSHENHDPSAQPSPGNDKRTEITESVTPEDFSSDTDGSDDDEPRADNHQPERRYPLRVRTQRKIPGTIPWDSTNLGSETDSNSSSSSIDEEGE